MDLRASRINGKQRYSEGDRNDINAYTYLDLSVVRN